MITDTKMLFSTPPETAECVPTYCKPCGQYSPIVQYIYPEEGPNTVDTSVFMAITGFS